MIDFLLCRNETIRKGGPELLEIWNADADAWLWIDLQDESQTSEQQLLVETLKFDQHAVTEAQRVRHPPGFQAFPDHLYLLTKPLTSDSESLDFETLQLAVFASPRLLVTRHSKYSRYIAMLQKQLLEKPCEGISTYSLTAAIARRVAERYGRILLDLERRLDEIEDELFAARTDQLMQELIGYNTALRKMRRILTYHSNAFEALRDHFVVGKDTEWHQEFADVQALMDRFQSLADLYQTVISDLIDGYISVNAHHLNQIMKVLTIVTVIFVPLTLLVGIYGMNFEYIPELKSRNGYFVLLTVMGVIATVLLLLFKRVRWL